MERMTNDTPYWNERMSAHDTISIQAAIDAIQKDRETSWKELDGEDDEYRSGCDDGYAYSMKVISELPSAQPEHRWIPCSERMPNEYGEYMFTWVTSYMPNKRFIGIAEYEVTDEWDAINGRWNGRWLFDSYMKVYPNVKVLAWMPLPKPWKGDTDE